MTHLIPGSCAGLLLTVLLLVSAAACQTTHGQSTGSYWDDTSITTAVKTRLASDGIGSVTRIDVETTRGVVHLNGVVDSIERKARAERMAGDVDGVSRVVNNLQVQR